MSVEEVDTLLQGVVTCGTNADEVTLEKLRGIPLLQLSRMMGKYLTGEEHVVNAVRVLGLATVNRRDRTIEEVDVMLRFFSRKLSSMQTIAVAVESTALLVRELSSEGPCTSDVFNVLHTEFLQSFSLQALPTNVRSWGYDVLRFTVTKETATWFTTPFLQVVLKSMDEENEPELLMRALELHHIIASYAGEDTMQPLLEEYFDSISSYFPVVFSQPHGCKVSKEDLRRVLSACMTHPLYLNICVPFLLSRMASPHPLLLSRNPRMCF
ncbi:Dos2-interacting transcription regulator of RNA-Pol-II [Trypanosoma brucei equiperdum]|uniref:MMS19 nucleotide excision repair protein n=1 Tax=Trypanosoma brucei equiperdum TaxID=630700 RepID=A0A3L6L2P6_9TRYP|nr:Dos2-interacting transcription regulator of RNA-Pol-II [Trypanosoma brucei equiperdum]